MVCFVIIYHSSLLPNNGTPRLQDETARVEDFLSQPDSLDALLKCFVGAKANSFENLLDPILKICRLSTAVTLGLSKSQFFRRVIDRLSHNKAVVRLNLLRILRAVCDVHPDRAGLVERYGLYEIVEKLSRKDGAVLVRELAREIMPALRMDSPPPGGSLKMSGSLTPKSDLTPKKRAPRRAASEASAAMGIPPNGWAGSRAKLKSSRTKLTQIPWNGQ
jgi:hypothetical protein